MRRWSAAAFVLGVALLTAAWVELSTYQQLVTELDLTDRVANVRSGSLFWTVDLLDVTSLRVAAGALAFMAISGLVCALIGVGRSGGALVAIGACGAVGLLAQAILEAQFPWGDCSGRGIDRLELHTVAPPLLLVVAVGASAVWLTEHRRRSLALRTPLLLSLMVVLMVGTAAALSLLPQEVRPHAARLGFAAISVLAIVALRLVARGPMLVSHVVSVSALGAGLLACVPAVALLHDQGLPLHAQSAYLSKSIDPVPLSSRANATLAPMVSFAPNEVMLSGLVLGTPVDGPGLEVRAFEVLSQLNDQYLEVWGRAADPTRRAPQVVADRTTPLAAFRAFARAAKRVGFKELQIDGFGFGSDEFWFVPLLHEHAYAVIVVLSDEGSRIDSFADWPALVHTADSSPTPLVLRVD